MRPPLPSGLVAFVKRECPTCQLVVPVLVRLAHQTKLSVYTQDDPGFPPGLEAVDDRDLAFSWHHEIETVPTLLRVGADGHEEARAVGWVREDWEKLTGIHALGSELPDWRPGCGSRSVEPLLAPELAARFGGGRLAARRVELAAAEDEHEALFARGWTDGLPVVAPTERRVLAMLDGTRRRPDEVVAVVPPDLVPCTVEKVAINAVLAGCKPEYLPVVLAAVEGACSDAFNAHGLLATTMAAGPVLVVNGPIRRRIGMNAGINVFGQGNRANMTIGRALQLVIRNVGGGRPGEVDRATHGNPGKLSFCFAEDEEGSPWSPLSTDLGGSEGEDTVTLFPGEGPRTVLDQLAREPEALVRSLAACLRTLHHPKLPFLFDALLAIGPEHARVFAEADPPWDKKRLVERLSELLQLPGPEIVRGADGMAEGVPEAMAQATLPKFRPGGLLVVHCGGRAGLFSMIVGGWVTGATGSQPTLREIGPWR